ncbi:MAG: acetate/propionate family kinase [Gemmatales bacterium]|nr:acetate/propionate family kinase [Gemmatales bacterium]
MKILVANLGSTSFKYRLFEMDDERLLARGGVERIGSDRARIYCSLGDRQWEEFGAVADHAAALELCLRQLTQPDIRVLSRLDDLAAVGFKAVHARHLTGVHRVDSALLDAMEAYNSVAPAHNPIYVRAMRLFAARFPQLPLVAAFETDFHRTIPPALRYYAVPYEWAERYGILRHGFHGASHRYIAERSAQLFGRARLRVISCHLGGSSSICAIQDGKSMACSLGMSPQSGLPHNNRVGDFDVFALPALMRDSGRSLDELLQELARNSGLLGLSGLSNDVRDLEQAAQNGHARAQLALDVFVASIRHYVGAYLYLLNGADMIVFTGGIGENSAAIRRGVCQNLDWFGIHLDENRNRDARGETPLHASYSRVQIWIIPTNEELIVARQTRDLLRHAAPTPGASACS